MRYTQNRFNGRRIWIHFFNNSGCISCHSKIPSLFLENPDVQVNRQSFKPDNSKFSFSKFFQAPSFRTIPRKVTPPATPLLHASACGTATYTLLWRFSPEHHLTWSGRHRLF